METRLFLASDYKEMSSWYEARGLKAPRLDSLPDFGLIVDKTAAGFMFNVDGKLALLEGYISNPKVDNKYRGAALDLITEELLSVADRLQISRVYASSPISAIQQRANKFGFLARPTVLLIRELKNG